MSFIEERLNDELEKRRANYALRELKIIKGKIDFSSNDYLGFAQDAELKKNIVKRIGQLRKLGSGGSRLLTGNNSQIEKLEKEIADFHAADACLFFNSGYEANAGLISTVTKRGDTILYDELVHASLREGIRLSNAASFSFRHNATGDLEQKLQKAEGKKFIIVESVYSMDGDICPLQEIVDIAEKYATDIILDEAHATGVIGERGEGLAQTSHLHERIFARVHTFGKAIGFNGAGVLGKQVLKDYLVNFCRPFIYTTAPNLLQVAAVQEAYLYLRQSEDLIRQLKENCDYFRHKMSRYKQLQLLPSSSAIFSVVIPGNENVKLAATYLQNGGQDVRAILTPTVPAGEERLRICMHSFNTQLEIDRLVKLLEQINEFIVREDENIFG